VTWFITDTISAAKSDTPHPGEAPVWPHERDHLASQGHWDAGTATEELLGVGCCLQPPTGTPLWNGTVDTPVAHRNVVQVDTLEATVLHTPGHTPGGICLALPGHVLTGDTLFPGGPGLTGWPCSDFPTILESIRASLFTLPGPTTVHPATARPRPSNVKHPTSTNGPSGAGDRPATCQLDGSSAQVL
jgi:hydroxyacylglutathione hydrolase